MLTRCCSAGPTCAFPSRSAFAERLRAAASRGSAARQIHADAPRRRRRWLLCHLGMSGRMRVMRGDGPPPRRRAATTTSCFTDDGDEIRFNDARRFGLMDLFAGAADGEHPLLPTWGRSRWATPSTAGLGRRPEGHGARRSRRPCWTRRWSPAWATSMSARRCSAPASRRGARPTPCRRAGGPSAWPGDRARCWPPPIEAGGSSLRDYVQADGELGYFQHQLAVYDREGEACPDCDARRAGGRSGASCKAAARPSIVRAPRISARGGRRDAREPRLASSAYGLAACFGLRLHRRRRAINAAVAARAVCARVRLGGAGNFLSPAWPTCR